MKSGTSYDAVVIGAGQAGVPMARALAEAGWSTALVEREHVAGTCINEGCTPTKTMVASARTAYVTRRAERFGVLTGPVTVDMVRVRQRKRDIVESWRQGSEGRIEATEGLDLIRGEARFTGPGTLAIHPAADAATVARSELTARSVIINTGARPTIPSLPGLSETPYLTSTTIMELDEVPGHLLVLGGGYVAVEFAQMFARFGSEVTVVQRGAQLLTSEDADIAAELAEILRKSGVKLVLGHEARSASRTPAGDIELTLAPAADAAGATVPAAEGAHDAAQPPTLRGTHLLVAVGRTPNSDDLDLHHAGIETDDRGYIVVDDRLETTAPGTFAAGDVKGGPAFTHISYDDFRVLRANLIEGGEASIAGRLVPYTVFTDPELGRVGLTEKQARAEGRKIRVARMPMSHVARALEMDEALGVMKAVVDAETDLILGAAVLGVAGGEIAAIVQTAMMGGVTSSRLREAVFTHPTLAESLNNLFGSWSE